MKLSFPKMISKHVQGLLFLSFALTSFLWASAALSLKPEYEADRLLMAAEQAFAISDFDQAAELLDRASQLGIELPADYDFLNGRLLQRSGQLEQAREKLESYVDKEGNEGIYYREALNLITDIERKQNQKQAVASLNTDSINEKVEIRLSGTTEEYVAGLRNQYGLSDSRLALAAHINKLLKENAYTNEGVIAGSRLGTPSQHRINSTSAGEVVSLNKIGDAESDPFREDRFPVYGLSPTISFDCGNTASSCWIRHPVTKQPWIQIRENERVANEVAKAISQLIRVLQKINA
ncbi:hypothetical protein NBRC116493_25710 [Aurantivibrio infirmus]